MLNQLVASGKLNGGGDGESVDPESNKTAIIREQILEEFNNQKQLRKQLQKLESEVRNIELFQKLGYSKLKSIHPLWKILVKYTTGGV